MIRLVASDLDNTMLPEGTFDLNPEYLDVIRALSDKGITFVAASGRHYNSMKRLLKDVSDRIIFLCGNGTYVSRAGSPMAVQELDRDLYLDVLHTFRSMDAGLILADTPELSWTDAKDMAAADRILSGYHLTVRSIDDLADLQGHILKIAMYCHSDAEAPAASVRQLYGDRANVMAAGEKWVDFVPAAADKARAMQAIQKQLGILPEETIAFGDNENDIGMLKLAGTSYAVSNARESVKESVTHVIGDMRDDAVLDVLRSLL